MRMASQAWYETAFMGRDQVMESLQVWHNYFLQDARRLAPGRRLLDIGCGTGNLLAAARQLGFRVAGIELDRNAARMAKKLLGDVPVHGLALSDFAPEHSDKFDVVTFFEVLEHQDRPREFLRLVRSCLKPGGYVGMSVPNRARWQHAREFVDIPPNHLTRWDAPALRTFLENAGFEVVRVQEQPVDIAYATGFISSHIRTGLVERLAGERHRTLTELAAMDPHEAYLAVQRREFAWRHRVGRQLISVKRCALWPLAIAVVPYVRLRGFKGEDLYCLARLRG
jgi:SAM-dependent methyltransferase